MTSVTHPPESQQPEQPQQPGQTQPTVPLAPYGAPYPGAVYAPHPSHLAASQQATMPSQTMPAQPIHQSAAAQQTPTSQGGAISTGASNGQKKSRAGVLFAGIAIGALVGGVVGGGASAIIASNQAETTVVQTQPGGAVTLNNLETATSVSGVAAAATPSVVTLQVSSRSAGGSGSGVIYSEDGYILTNAHVVQLDGAAGANSMIRVWLSDGRILDGTLVGTDPFADIAVVKVDADGLVPIELADPGSVNVGDLAVAIGAPLNLSNTVTSGVVSALYRGISVGSPIIPEPQADEPEDSDDGDFPWFRFGDPNEDPNRQQQQTPTAATTVTLPVVQTDASINPGNSGGALLNANAELIGVNVAIASNGATATTAGSDGLGFAIPVGLATRVADSLIAGERPSHGLLGVGVNDSSADTDEDRNFAGALLSSVVPGGAADEAGLRVGDVVTAVGDIPVDSGKTASALIRMHEGGEEVVITYTRGGVPGQTNVTLGVLDW